MNPEPTRALATFAALIDAQALPERVTLRAKTILLDALACALAGHEGDETPQVTRFANALGRSEESTILGGGRASLAGATLVNGFLITAVTMCDTHTETLTHVMPEVLPAALAIGEQRDASGRDLLAAIIAGLEVATRVGIGIDYPVFRAKGWHGPGVFGPFGAAAAAGRLLELDADAMARAFGLAGSQAAGTYAAWGTPTVKFHQCRGALSGVMAALLASEGFVATREFLSVADGGLYTTYAAGGKAERAIADLGLRWELERIALRPWPAASNLQGAVTALFELIEQHRIDTANIDAVRIGMSRVAFDMHGGFARYQAKFEALLSVHYAAAAILHDRALTLRQFAPARYDDPALRRFAAEHVVVHHDASLAGSQATAEIRFHDGRTLATRCTTPRGAADKPLSFAQVEAKFRTYAAARLAPAKIDAAIDAVRRLEMLDSTRSLLALIG